MDDIRQAQQRQDKAHVVTLLHVLHHFLEAHPQFRATSLSVRFARAADVAESHLFRHSDSYLYSGAALS